MEGLIFGILRYIKLLIFFSVFSTSHGNKCAGIIAGEANNAFCGVGIAYNANIGGECM